jgi:hypothetical protein
MRKENPTCALTTLMTRYLVMKATMTIPALAGPAPAGMQSR